MSDLAAIEETLRRLGRLLYSRDPSFADEFIEDAILVGSGAGEIARGREAIRALIATFHALPARYTWDWERIDCELAGDTAWFLAEGAVVREDEGGDRVRRPYRLSGVLRSEARGWRWALFHGAEPAEEA